MKSAAKPRKMAPPPETAPPVPPDAARIAALYEDTAHLQPFYHLTMWLPDAERETLVRQILTVARSNLIMGSEERAAALMSVAPCLPETERAAILREVLETATSPDPFVRGVLDKYESKALVENREKPPYKPDMDGLHNYLKSQGVPEPRQPQLAAKIDRLVKAELTGRDAAPKLSDADLAAFMAHAKSHKWKPRSVAPSAFIAETFKTWLRRGLRLKDVHDAQRNLAGAYSAEVSRDPRKRIAGLIATREKLPVGAPRPPSSRPVAELPEKEKLEKRQKDTATKRRWRQTQQGLSL